MLTFIEVFGYQSLKSRARIELGRFTTITGPTGSGKSGLLRAVQLVVSNAKGTTYITRGERRAYAALSGAESPGQAWAAGIMRTTAGKDDNYTIGHPDGSEPVVYTKLGGKVPDDVARLLRLGAINFAAQFDSPYLLGKSGGDVARTLGELTNATLILNAAREGNKRVRATEAELKHHQQALDRLVAEARGYTDLPAQLTAVGTAEDALVRAQEAASRATRLQSLLEQLDSAARRQAAITVPVVPTLDGVLTAQQRYERFTELTQQLIQQGLAQKTAEGRVTAAEQAGQQAQAALDDCLRELGVCPVCGQSTSRLQHAH
jgi:DNA repair exonuclease SbcCD ATPase subunit